ncbi:NUDIX hydrolase [Streptosporangium sandarakinum]
MTDTFPADAVAPFSRIRIRVAALVFCGDDVALIRRDRPTSTHYTPIGGNVETGEDVLAALGRELHEELGLDLGKATTPELLWVVDQMVSRPGPAPSPRKLHLIHRVHVTLRVRAGLATVEYDELPDGTHEVGHIEWRDYRTTRDLPIFPPIGPALAGLPAPHAAITDAGLPAVTDDNYTWIV